MKRTKMTLAILATITAVSCKQEPVEHVGELEKDWNEDLPIVREVIDNMTFEQKKALAKMVWEHEVSKLSQEELEQEAKRIQAALNRYEQWRKETFGK